MPMKKKLFLFIFAVAAATATGASAASIFDITFPVAELGGCADQASCKVYCDDATHQQACRQFAVDHGFVSKENASHSEQIQQKIKDAGGGPGGCADENACRSYCQDPAHVDECVAFGEAHGLIDQKNLRQIKRSGLVSGPGGCQGSDACRAYCADASHAEECLSFAEKNNLISSAEAARAKKFIAVSQSGGPGGCTGTQCRDHCADPSHHDECFAFAKKNGLITRDQANQSEAVQKIQQTVRESGGPGGCKDDNTCRDYCTDPSHVEECVAFASAHGGVSADQARQMLKDFTNQKNQASGDFNQAQDASRQEQDSQQKFEQFRALEQQFRTGAFQGQQLASPQGQGSSIGRPSDSSANQGNQNPGSGNGVRVGPGGCASPAACIQYCTEHQDECFASMTGAGSSGGMPPPQNRQADNQSSGTDHQQSSGDMPSHAFQLRQDLIHAFTGGQLPPDFQQMPEDARQQFFKAQMQGQQQTQHGEQSPSGGLNTSSGASGNGDHTGQDQNKPSGAGFPFHAPSGSPGRPGLFPGGSHGFPGNAPRGFPGPSGRFPGMNPDSGQGGMPGQQPPPGGPTQGMPAGSSDHQFPQSGGLPDQRQPGGTGFNQPPPGGSMPPPSGGGTFTPPPGGFESSGGSFSPPPSGGSVLPPSGSPPPSGGGNSMPPPPPSSSAPIPHFFGAILNALTH